MLLHFLEGGRGEVEGGRGEVEGGRGEVEGGACKSGWLFFFKHVDYCTVLVP